MIAYPYYTPQVLTDSIFVKFGGQIGTSTSQQREMAYLLAEEQMTEHLDAFLVPTTVTGSVRQIRGRLYQADYGHIRRVFSVDFLTIYNTSPLDLRTTSGSAVVWNSEQGILNIFGDDCYFGGCSGYGQLYAINVAYESGFSTGTSNQPAMLSALTLAAQINLNEMDVSLSNEGVADIGVQRFSNQAYSEDRKKLGNTIFGNSAVAQRIARLVKKYRSRPAIVFR